MKTTNKFLILTILLIVLTSCYKRRGWGITGRGESVTETRHATDFDRISLSGSSRVEYTQDSVFFLEVTGQPNVLAVLKTEVKSGELKIWFDRNVMRHNEVLLRVHSPQMRGLTVSGSGDIESLKKIQTDNLDCDVSGSGNIYMPELVATHFSSKISGSGNVKIISGRAHSQVLNVSGSGNIKAEEFECVNADVRVSGSGNVTLNVSESLKVRISGSGDVRYKGSPVIDAEISGSGKLTKIQ